MNDSVLQKLFPICSGVVAVTGSVTNALSLSFFIRKAARSLSNRIFIFLNIFDLLVCLFSVGLVVFGHCKGHKLCGYKSPLAKFSDAVVHLSAESTAFATCVQSVTRTISLCFPFYLIQKKALTIAAITFLVQEVFRYVLRFYIYNRRVSDVELYRRYDSVAMIALLSIVILTNLFSSMLSVWKLSGSRRKLRIAPANGNVAHRTKTNQKATVTILIISILFCFFNAIFCITMYFETIEGRDTHRLDTSPTLLLVLYGFSFGLAVPLNSAINPIIYFTRKREMTKYIQELISVALTTNSTVTTAS